MTFRRQRQSMLAAPSATVYAVESGRCPGLTLGRTVRAKLAVAIKIRPGIPIDINPGEVSRIQVPRYGESGMPFSPEGATEFQPRATPWVEPHPEPSPERASQTMAQSLARLPIHLVFSTKHRDRVIHDQVRAALHAYLAVVLRNLRCPPIEMNSVEDHIHILLELSRTVSISEVVEEVKKSSSRWIKTQGFEFNQFAWQAGYGAFAVSESNVNAVRDYIINQPEHHRIKSFQEEYRSFLERHRISFDEKYVWE